MKFKNTVILIIAMLSVGISAFASGDQFSITFPDYYTQVSDTEWHTDNFSINGNPATVDATVKFESSTLSEKDAFSEHNIADIENSVKASDGFERFAYEPEEITTGVNDYRCIHTSYVADINGTSHGIAKYYFYSKDKMCVVELSGNDKLFALAGGTGIIETITFKDDFYSPNSEPAVEDTADSVSTTKENSSKEDSNDWWIFLIIFPLLGLCVYFVANEVYWNFDHGKWDKDATPDINANVVDISSKKESYGKNNTKFKTTVKFSDGYRFITTKTKRQDKLLTYKISIDEELSKKIIDAAKASHEKAVKKLEHKM